MNKRKRFVLVSILLTLGLLATQLIPFDQRYAAIIIFFGISILLSGWALHSDLVGIQWFTVLILPSLYPLSVALFYFLLPQEPVSRYALLTLFGFGMYALLLTENIYSVAAARTIQLLRAAHAVGFLLTVITSIFLIGTIFGFKFSFLENGPLTAISLFPLFVGGLWSATLESHVKREVWIQSLVLSLIGGELAVVVSFLPMIPLVSAIVVSGYLYVILGLEQQEAQGRLFAKTIQEYVLVGFMVVIAALFVSYR